MGIVIDTSALVALERTETVLQPALKDYLDEPLVVPQNDMAVAATARRQPCGSGNGHADGGVAVCLPADSYTFLTFYRQWGNFPKRATLTEDEGLTHLIVSRNRRA